MNQELLSRLDALAAKLGVAVTHLWAVLQRQAYVEFATWVVIALVMGFGWWLWSRLARPLTKKDYPNDFELAAIWLPPIGLTVGSLIAVIGVIVSLGGALNPEFYALSKVLEVLK